MNGQRWIDDLFRKRLDRRIFPVEKGEFDEVRALIAKHNSTTAMTRRGGFSKWWLSALIPIAGLLWWALAGTVDEAELHASPIAEQQPTVGRNNAEQGAHLEADTSNEVLADPSTSVLEVETAIDELPATNIKELATPENGARAFAEAKHGSRKREMVRPPRTKFLELMDEPDHGRIKENASGGVGTDRSLRTGARPEQGSMNAQAVADRDGMQPSLGSGEQQEQSSMNANAPSGVGTAQSFGTGARPEQSSMNAQAVDDLDGMQPSLGSGEQQEQSSVNAQAVEDRHGIEPSLGSREQQEQSSVNAQAVEDRTGTRPSLGSVEQPKQGNMDPQADDDLDGMARSLQIAARPQQSSVDARADDQVHTTSSEAFDVLSDRGDAYGIEFMVLRSALPGMVDPPMPVCREVPVFKRLPRGELHVFGAPLAVRTKSSGGHRSGVQAGTLFGLEYRVRAERFLWATGIYYGSYALKADQGAADVLLTFVEVPLLASYELGNRRFRVLMQGGLSMDLLFNSSGSYPVSEARLGAGFPDDAFRTVNCSWLLRPQATYQLDEHLSVSAGPLWKAQLGNVAKEGALDGARVTSSGISFGITWRLDRSTY